MTQRGKSRVGDLGLIEPQGLEPGQDFEMLQPVIGDGIAPDPKEAEVLEALEVLQTVIRDLVVVKVQPFEFA
jgi:hypothetical protein